MGSINSLKKKLTIIIVSHRLSTIKNCDYIFFIKDGKIIDKGNLNYLLKKYPEDLFEKNKSELQIYIKELCYQVL